MYNIIDQIIDHQWINDYGNTEQQLIYYGCIVLIVILTVVIIDLIYRVFRHFWR